MSLREHGDPFEQQLKEVLDALRGLKRFNKLAECFSAPATP